MKSIVNNDQSIFETEFILNQWKEPFFPLWVQEEFYQISCLCDSIFDKAYVRDAKVKVEFLVDGKPVHEHNFTFKGGGSLHSAIKDEISFALGNHEGKTSKRVRITTTPESA